MRAFGRVILWLLVILLVLAVLAVVFLGTVIKTSFNNAAPAFLGVPAHVENVQVRLFQGRLVLEGLAIGNPDGFNTPDMIRMSRMAFEVDPRSLFTDRIQIREVTVDGFHLTLEQGLRRNNLLTLANTLSGEEKAEVAEKKEEKTAKEIRVEIDTVDITDTQLNVAMTAMAGKSVPIPLPPIHLKDIGKDKDGASITEATMAVLAGILDAVAGAVSGAGDLLSGTFGAGADAVKAIGSSVGGAITNLSSSAVDAAAVVAGTAADAVSKVKGAAGSTVGSLAGAAGGLVSTLSGKADEAAEGAGDAAADAKAGLKDAEKSVKDAWKDQKEDLSKAADDAKANLKDTEKALKETWKEQKDDLSDSAKETLGQLKSLFGD